MRNLIVTSILALILPVFAFATDAELEEKLKAVMILFERSQEGLKEEIASLQLQLSYQEKQNEKLTGELSELRRENLDLKTELLILQSRSPESQNANELVDQEEVAVNSAFAAIDQQAAGPRGRGQGGRGQGGRQAAIPEQTVQPAVAPEDMVDINSATKEELLALPLVNEFLADNIINGRPWESLEDLIQLQGFGPMKLRRLQPFATAAPISELTEETASEIPVN